jgi:ubiquinone/menaquinone biosynthesis C-methylase UbiE
MSGFDRVAKIYRWAEYLTFGRTLERCRFYFLRDLHDTQNALVLGDGDGRFTQRLLQTAPHVYLQAVDESATMLQLLQKRCAADESRLHICCADATTFIPSQPIDLVVTHFFLDCLSTEQVRLLAEGMHRSSMPGGRWLISEFDVAEGWRGLPHAMLVRFLYAAFRLVTGLHVQCLPKWRAALKEAGFVRDQSRSFHGGLLVSEIWLRREIL